ncbi:large subunit ribosomal protein L26e [Enteropsectra breve]|nr:large subunit ribosomal protein L26e [Enteropsectra breve]
MAKSIKSTQRRKQRKAMFTADTNEKRVMMSSHLSKSLRAMYGFRSFPIHSQDVVLIKVGKFKNREGKVERVCRSTGKVTVEGCTMNRSTGGTILYPMDASNLEIKSLYLDEDRTASLERKKAIYEKSKAKFASAY